jgi:proline iminopeptidase
VIIVPGGPGLDAAYMLPVARMIAHMRYHVILLEPRGTGSSRAALGNGARLTVEGSIDDVEAVRGAAGIEKAVVVGHSFGGAVAQAYAAAYPDRVQSLLLMDSTGPSMHAPKPTDGWRKRGTPDELALYDKLRAEGDRIGAMRIKFKLSFYHRSAAEKFLATIPADTIHLDAMPLSNSYDRDFHLTTTTQPPFPVYVVSGQIDWIRGHEPALQATYPNLHVFLVPHAGHFPWADAPKATKHALEQALAHPG